jgi:hypothetical protein
LFNGIMSPPGIEPGLPQSQCRVISTIRRRQDLIIQKKRDSYHNNTTKIYLFTIPVSTSITN